MTDAELVSKISSNGDLIDFVNASQEVVKNAVTAELPGSAVTDKSAIDKLEKIIKKGMSNNGNE